MISKIIQLKDIVKYNNIEKWCKLPYPGHPKGCPNYNNKKTCPPKVSSFEKLIKPPFTLVAVKFNLEEHVKKMKQKHPNWTDKQARCILYWQGKVNKQLRELSEKTASKIPNSKILHTPEANSVNLFETCKRVKFIIKPNPQKIIWKMSIIGIKVNPV